VGFVGLPPEGATPSAPESGELVASLWSHIRLDPVWGTGELFLYADGRVIWTRRDGRSLGEGANEHSTGFLEQRLTPEGIELVRSEILATGLFDSDSPPPDDVDGSLRVGVQGEDGTWRVNAQESALDQEQSDALLQLAQRLSTWSPGCRQVLGSTGRSRPTCHPGLRWKSTCTRTQGKCCPPAQPSARAATPNDDGLPEICSHGRTAA
jgi:hypothetical protein